MGEQGFVVGGGGGDCDGDGGEEDVTGAKGVAERLCLGENSLFAVGKKSVREDMKSVLSRWRTLSADTTLKR